MLFRSITRGKVSAEAGAHLDPDIDYHQYPRSRGWQPLLGQHGSAQGHLAKQGVGQGDLFLFFGLFQPIIQTDDGWRFDRTQSPCHHFWGWLQIGSVNAVNELADNELPWSRYHPHFHLPTEKNNSLYIATKQLNLGKSPQVMSGAGTFSKSHAALQLTAPDARTPSQWRVPSWMYPAEGKTPLSYHYKLDRWQEPAPKQRYTQLQAVARGQEFVLDSQDYPQAKRWAQNLISRHGGQPVE